MSHKAKRIWVVAAVLWAAVIFATSCTFIERQVFIDFVKRFIPAGVPQHLWVGFWGAFGLFVVKAYHMAEYAVLCCFLSFALRCGPLKKPLQAIAAGAVLAALYATTDEWHQTFVPGRGGTWVDVVIDCCGITLAVFFLRWRLKRDTRRDGENTL